MVAAGALIEPLNAAADIGVRSGRRRVVRGTLWHPDPLIDWDRVAARGCAAADASLRIRAHLGRGRIAVLAERSVVGLAAYVANRKHDVLGDLAFYRETPLLDGGCHQVWIDSAGAIDRAEGRHQR